MNYFVFDPLGELNCFYYGTDGSIYQRVFSNRKWSRAVCVISDVRRHFTVMRDKEIIVLCQERSGDMVLCKRGENGWETNVILESRGIDPPDMRMQRIGDCVLYNLPQGREQLLISQRQTDGKWQHSEQIDSFAPFAVGLYRLIDIPDKRKVLIYRKNTPKQRLYFRIGTEDGDFGDPKTVYTTSGLIMDCSAVFFKGYLHFLIAVRGRFSSTAVYVRAAEQAAERNSTVLWEGNMETVAIRAENDRLIASLGAGRRLYTFTDPGGGFKGIDHKISSGGLKKAFVCSDGNICCNELIVPADRPYETDVSVLMK